MYLKSWKYGCGKHVERLEEEPRGSLDSITDRVGSRNKYREVEIMTELAGLTTIVPVASFPRRPGEEDSRPRGRETNAVC